jgi:hypothetical protein
VYLSMIQNFSLRSLRIFFFAFFAVKKAFSNSKPFHAKTAEGLRKGRRGFTRSRVTDHFTQRAQKVYAKGAKKCSARSSNRAKSSVHKTKKAASRRPFFHFENRLLKIGI